MQRPSALIGALLLASLTHGCASLLPDGDIGTPRVFGLFRGSPPDVQLYAPVADRGGNIYVLGGKRDVADVTAFIGRPGGSFTASCRLTKGDRPGPIGWVGSASATKGLTTGGADVSRPDRQWYWSGNALVGLSSLGNCYRVLNRDPSTGADLVFEAILPWVQDAPSTTTLIALLRASSDELPFTVRVDLNANVYTTPRGFEPEDARNLVVHGAGANPEKSEGWVLLSFDEGGSRRIEGRYYDEGGELTARVPIDVGDELPAYGVRGFLHANDAGLVAGLVSDGRLVLFDRGGGRTVKVGGMRPVGLHVWDGSLYVVGTSGNQPVIASILDEGSVTEPAVWQSSKDLLAALQPGLLVTDDRQPPRRTTRFDAPRAVDAFPLITEHTSHRYAEGETLLAIAGPVYGEGDGAFTLVAVAPAGVSYS